MSSVTVKGVVALMRPPFHTVGLIPLLVGFALARYHGHQVDSALLLMALTVTFLVMFSTYALGDYYDQVVDQLSADLDRNRFSGGSQAVILGLVSPKAAWAIGYAALGGAAILGIMICFQPQSGPWTLPLGVLGAVCGVFYTTPPLCWSRRGVGEAMIFVCYGPLPVAIGYYLTTGGFSSQILAYSLPIGCSIANVILINEYPDYRADLAAGKSNLMVRLGRERGALIIQGLNFVGMFSIALFFPWLLFWTVPLYLIFGWLVHKQAWNNPGRLEKTCALAIVLNLLISISFLIKLLMK